jgi:YggT family protein
MDLLCRLILLYQVVIIARIVLSWFPLQPGGIMSRINGVLIMLTEWLLGPLRRIVPRVGMLDFSPFIAILLVAIVARILCA